MSDDCLDVHAGERWETRDGSVVYVFEVSPGTSHPIMGFLSRPALGDYVLRSWTVGGYVFGNYQGSSDLVRKARDV